MTQEEMLKIKSEMDNAGQSTTPFAVIRDDKLSVVGDANDTKTVLTDYTITFKLPDGKGGVMKRDVEYKNIFITPRQETKLSRLFAELMPYYKKVKEDGTVEDYSEAELDIVLGELSENVISIMYDLVAGVLGVAPELIDFMEPESVMDAVAKILRSYPQYV